MNRKKYILFDNQKNNNNNGNNQFFLLLFNQTKPTRNPISKYFSHQKKIHQNLDDFDAVDLKFFYITKFIYFDSSIIIIIIVNLN